MHSQSTTKRAGPTSPSVADGGTVDRERLVRRHNVCQRNLDPRSPVSVGNGEFAFTMDLRGPSSSPHSYPVGARDELPSPMLNRRSTCGRE